MPLLVTKRLNRQYTVRGRAREVSSGSPCGRALYTRWMATRHIAAQYAEALKEMCQNSKQTTANNHAEHNKTRMARDEQDVIKIVEYVAESQNPFDLDTVPGEIVNITTGQIASRELSIGLGNFLEVAQKHNITFLEKRLVVDRTLSFWDTDKRSTTPTFVNMSKCLTSNKTDKIMMGSELLFRRLLAVSKQRDVNLEQVLSHELAPVPPSLFNDDGTTRKTAKAELAKKLESNCDEIQVLAVSHDNHTAYIIHGMALLQALDESKFDTFNDLGLVVMQIIQSNQPWRDIGHPGLRSIRL